MTTSRARAAVLHNFRWVDGHADVWRLFSDGPVLAEIVAGLAEPWQGSGVTRVVGIEARGFLLGAATAVRLGGGFVGVRKGGTGLLPGPKVTTTADEDYLGRRHDLRMQADLLGSGDRVLLVDDWAERGSQARAAARLVTDCGATFLGVSLIVDQLTETMRTELGRVTRLVTADELGPSEPAP